MPGDMNLKGGVEKLIENAKARVKNDLNFVKQSWTVGLLPAAKEWAETSSHLNRELAPAFLKMK